MENASSRLRCRSRKQNSAPVTAVATPNPRKIREIACWCPSAAPNIVQYTRATPYSPNSTMTPENSTQTGVGATACASASQKWNGTMAAFTIRPEMISRNATMTRPPGRRPAIDSAIWAMFSAPVLP